MKILQKAGEPPLTWKDQEGSTKLQVVGYDHGGHWVHEEGVLAFDPGGRVPAERWRMLGGACAAQSQNPSIPS